MIITSVFRQFDFKKKFYLILIILGMLTNVVLELVSIGSIYPLIYLLIDSNSFFDSKVFYYINKLLNLINLNLNKDEIVSVLIYLLIIIFVAKTLFVLILNFFQIKLDYSIKFFFKAKLINKFLSNNNNIFYFNHSSFLRSLTIDIDHLTSFVSSSILLISDLILIFALLIILYMLYGNVTFLVYLLIFLFSFLYFKIISKKIAVDANARQLLASQNLEKIQNLFLSCKEIILSKKNKIFLNDFIIQTKKLYNTFVFKVFLNKSIKYILEFIIVLSILSIIFFNLDNYQKLQQILVKLSVLVIIFIRLLPSVIRVITSLQDIKFASSAVVSLIGFLNYKSLDKNETYKTSEKILNFNQIKISDLSFSYKKEKNIFKNVNLTLKKGLPIFLTGDSGKGKSTFILLLTGFLKADTGKFYFDSTLLKDLSQFTRNSISYMPQRTYLINGTIKENILFGNDDNVFDKDIYSDVIEITGINKKTFQNFDINDESVGENGSSLSIGQIQRISIARSLYQNANLIILDEATNSLDRESEIFILKNIINWCNHKNKMLLAVSHHMPNLDNIRIIDFNKFI